MIDLESMSVIEILSNYTRTGMVFCLVVQLAAILLGRVLKKPTLQRMAISITCAFTAFSVGTYTSSSSVTWVLMFTLVFVTTYFFTPKFVGECDRAVMPGSLDDGIK